MTRIDGRALDALRGTHRCADLVQESLSQFLQLQASLQLLLLMYVRDQLFQFQEHVERDARRFRI
jgi:hypothetical protein